MNNNEIFEINNRIDNIDKKIIKLIAIRARQAKKGNIPAEQVEMLRKIRQWAYMENINPDIIEKLYKDYMGPEAFRPGRKTQAVDTYAAKATYMENMKEYAGFGGVYFDME